MPATRPRASFEPIAPDFDLKRLVETTRNFSYVDRISCDMIEQQGMAAFEKLITLHVVNGGKPLVIDGFDQVFEPWTFTPQWLRSNCGDKQENAWDLKSKEMLPLTIRHYLSNMGILTNQFFSKPGAHKELKRQRVYLKDIDCPEVWQDKLRTHIPSSLYYLNESTGEPGGPGAVPEGNPGRRLGRGIGRAGDLMSSLPPDMRADNLMCYIGHEGTFTPAHREMCASLGQNIMVEASGTVSDDGKPEKPGSSIWFMTESKERHLVSEYFLSVLGHDIEVENHFAQVVAWKKAPFNVYVVEQRPGDFILIPPLAPHQVWNRGTRTMKVAWNRTTVETLDMALQEALPNSRIVCRDEQYKNKAIVYYTLQKYSGLLVLAQSQASRMSQDAAVQLMTSSKIKQLGKDFRRLFGMYRRILLSEMFGPDDAPKAIEYLPFDGNVTCAYCRGNVFNRFLTCSSCKDALGHTVDNPEGDPYDVCLDCYAMGRSCACISNLKWVEQFRWKELAAKYETWRRVIISLDHGRVSDKTPLPIQEEKKRYGRKTLAEVCKEQLKRRPYKDPRKGADPADESEDADEEIVVGDDGMVKKIVKKRSKAWLKNHNNCHVCKKLHPIWKMAECTHCDRWWCYGTLFRGWDKMPYDVMSDADWTCPHCLNVCFAGSCKLLPNMTPHEPKGTLLGHDTKKVADVRSVEALVDFSVSNLNWLKDDDPANRAESRRLQRAGAEAQRAKAADHSLEDEEDDHAGSVVDQPGVEESRIEMEHSPAHRIDPALGGNVSQSPADEDEEFARRLREANAALSPPQPTADHAAPDAHAEYNGFSAVNRTDYVSEGVYPQPGDSSAYAYPGHSQTPIPVLDRNEGTSGSPQIRPFLLKRARPAPDEDISMSKAPKAKKQRLTAAGFRSTDLATEPAPGSVSKAKNEAQRQFELEKERKALDKAKAAGRFIMLQAALKGKKRVVRLKIPAARLAHILAQQAAKAALLVGDEDDDAEAEIESQDGVRPAEGGEDEDEDNIILRSDIRPPKQAREHRKHDEQAAKKAYVPVEKDDNYDIKAKAVDGPSRKVKGKKGQAVVDYEEVNIGSDEDDVGGDPSFATRDRRSLPGYKRRRHADDDDDDETFPDQLPSNFRLAGKPRGRPSKKAAASAPSSTRKETAGKKPAMRPSIAAPGAANGDDTDGGDTASPLPAPVTSSNGASAADRAMPSSKAAAPSVVKRATGRPRKLGLQPMQPAATAPPPPSQSHVALSSVDEDNRMAKLQALQMYGPDAPSANSTGSNGRELGRGAAGRANDDDDDDSDDDGPDEIPAN